MTGLRLIGIDPGLQRTGWGIIEAEGNRLRALGCGVLRSTQSRSLAERLAELHAGLTAVIAEWAPHEAAVEETFVNKNPVSTLKLGQARGIALLVPALAGLPVHEYATNAVKSAVVGAGHADKTQVAMMVGRLLPGLGPQGADATDALAVAICHAHHAQTKRVWAAPAPASGLQAAIARTLARSGGGT
jgi:crossover junction endodeoxyribonuclease RuvC